MAKPTPIKPPARKGHRNVKDMVRDLLADEPGVVAEFEARLDKRQLVKSLAVIRARAGLSQQELAAKMGCSQSKISKIERGVDADLGFGDVEAYLRATGHEAKIFVVPGGGTLVDEVKMHAFRIKHLLDRMVELAETDGAMATGVADFIEEAEWNLARITKKARYTLPQLSAEPSRPIHVETPEPDDAVEPTVATTSG